MSPSQRVWPTPPLERASAAPRPRSSDSTRQTNRCYFFLSVFAPIWSHGLRSGGQEADGSDRRSGLEGTNGMTTALLSFNSQPFFFLQPCLSAGSPRNQFIQLTSFTFICLVFPPVIKGSETAAEEQQEGGEEEATSRCRQTANRCLKD